MKYIIVTKVDFVAPYKVEMFASLSLKETPEISWTFSRLEDAIEVGQDLAKRNDGKFCVFGDITDEAAKMDMA